MSHRLVCCAASSLFICCLPLSPVPNKPYMVFVDIIPQQSVSHRCYVCYVEVDLCVSSVRVCCAASSLFICCLPLSPVPNKPYMVSVDIIPQQSVSHRCYVCYVEVDLCVSSVTVCCAGPLFACLSSAFWFLWMSIINHTWFLWIFSPNSQSAAIVTVLW